LPSPSKGGPWRPAAGRKSVRRRHDQASRRRAITSQPRGRAFSAGESPLLRQVHCRSADSRFRRAGKVAGKKSGNILRPAPSACGTGSRPSAQAVGQAQGSGRPSGLPTGPAGRIRSIACEWAAAAGRRDGGFGAESIKGHGPNAGGAGKDANVRFLRGHGEYRPNRRQLHARPHRQSPSTLPRIKAAFDQPAAASGTSGGDVSWSADEPPPGFFLRDPPWRPHSFQIPAHGAKKKLPGGAG